MTRATRMIGPVVIVFVLGTCALSEDSARPIDVLGAGRFGQALEARSSPAFARELGDTTPLTVECWAKLDGRAGFNIVLANGPKESRNHWELYSYAGNGRFSAYLPDCTPAEVVSEAVVTDGQWHALGMVLEPARIRLYVDGREVASKALVRLAKLPVVPGDLTFGLASSAGGPIGCEGLVDEVRIRRVAEPPRGLPTEPFVADAATIGLWHFDQFEPPSRLADASAQGNHAQTMHGRSLDAIDAEHYAAGPGPLESEAQEVALHPGSLQMPEGASQIVLDGVWDLAEGGEEAGRTSGAWADAMRASVPGSIHTALAAAGRIPDPKFGRNDAIAHDQSFKTWWYRRRFEADARMSSPRLVFEGVAIRCDIWLNGELLGSHDGMFGGPEFDIAGKLRAQNELVVRIHPAPGDPKAWNNPDWRKTVVFNNVWGWHYSSIPALGIWRSVRIEGAPAVSLGSPFVAATDAAAGVVDLAATLGSGDDGAIQGRLLGEIRPANFEGSPQHFELSVQSKGSKESLHLRMKIDEPRLWWPNGLGEPNLYELSLAFQPEGAGKADVRRTKFGIRTIRMAPLPGGPRRDRFDWTFVINGRPTFIKGTGWCTMDSSMDFSRGRYERFLTLAQQQNVQMLRAWGSGMPETDDFYDLCDRLGLMVFQEWPTAWNSHVDQPFAALEETVRLNTKRIRNHPSLAIYAGGNESGAPFGPAIDMMGRLAKELDGTRTFHRGEPWGGSAHNYNCYWGREPLDHNLTLTAPFFGEFGLACMPVHESVLRYLPDAEKAAWPAPADGTLVHHTPIFGTAEDWSRLSQYSAYFTAPKDLPTFIVGSQLSQVVGVRHTLERARSRWPNCAGALYYKLNDNYPAASWSSVDWYGAPKLGHWFFRSAFAPLHACVLPDHTDVRGKPIAWPVQLLDDAGALEGKPWAVVVRALDEKLMPIKSTRYAGQGGIDRVRHLGDFELSAEQTGAAPLFLVADVEVAGEPRDRWYAFFNYESPLGGLFTLPRTRLTQERLSDQRLRIKNEGALPAVCVQVERDGHAHDFQVSDSAFWLDPGESRMVEVDTVNGLRVGAWNVD